MSNSASFVRDCIAQIFGDHVLIPADLPQAPVLAQYVSAITPGNAPLLAGHGVPTLGEELAHILSTIELYLDAVAPGKITSHKWLSLIMEGAAYEAYEALRREAEAAVHDIQPERELNFDWLKRPVKVRDVLWHVADHSAHHRGRLSLLMRMSGIEPPKV